MIKIKDTKVNYRIFQINLTRDQTAELRVAGILNDLNRSGNLLPEFYKRYLATTHKPTSSAIWAAFDLYKIVATIEAENLDGVFKIGNIGPEEKIARLSTSMHSVSIGDLVHDEKAGKMYYVDMFGFKALGDDKKAV